MPLSHVRPCIYYNYAPFLGSYPQDLLIYPSKIFN
jgi:hypothetical protein